MLKRLMLVFQLATLRVRQPNRMLPEFTGDAETINVSISVSDATGESGILLTLADSDDTGLDVECKALLVASAPGTTGNNPYADTDRGGTDTPLDGEIGIGDANTLVSRIRRNSETQIALNSDGNPEVLALSVYFVGGGDGNDLTLYLQTAADDEVSFTVASALASSGTGYARFDLPVAAQTLMNGIATGDRWIFKFARPSVTEFDGDAETIIVSVLVSDATGEATEPGAIEN